MPDKVWAYTGRHEKKNHAGARGLFVRGTDPSPWAQDDNLDRTSTKSLLGLQGLNDQNKFLK